MKINHLILILIFFYSSFVYSQDNIIEEATSFRIGAGYDLNYPAYGLYLFTYYKVVSIGFAFNLPQSSSDKAIKEFKNGITLKARFVPLFIHNNKYVFPVYSGIGYTLLNEKNKVSGYTGDGKITGLHYFIGFATLPGEDSSFLSKLNAHFEFGYTSWIYDDSVLKKSNSGLDYNYSNFFFSIGLSYLFL